MTDNVEDKTTTTTKCYYIWRTVINSYRPWDQLLQRDGTMETGLVS